jgi:hypothetical protein
MSRSDTGGVALIDRAMSGAAAFVPGARAVTAVEEIAKVAALIKNARRAKQAKSQGGQSLDSFAPGVSAEGMTGPVVQVGKKVRTNAGRRRSRRAQTGE